MTGAAPPSSREYGIAVSFGMRTVAETPVFVRYAAEVWSDTERQEFISFIAANPESGDVIAGRAVVARFGGRGQALASAAVRASSTSSHRTPRCGC
jgi:hypothetical protein